MDALQVLESCQKDENLRLNSLPSAVWLRSGQVRGLRSHGVLSVHLKQLGESDFGHGVTASYRLGSMSNSALRHFLAVGRASSQVVLK